MHQNYTQFQDEKRRISPRFRSNKVELPTFPQSKELPSSQGSYTSYSQPTYHQQALPSLSLPIKDEGIKRSHKQPGLESHSHSHTQPEENYSGIQIPADWDEAKEHAVKKEIMK